jgi:23S rRNA pseudouridine1911/1915/1917 synthase
VPDVIKIHVDESGAGARLDAWLAHAMPEHSRSRIRIWIEQGLVTVDGALPRPATRLRSGQAVIVTVPTVVAAGPQPEALPLRIIHEDANLAVVDKPAGLVVHPGAGVVSGTLVNALLHHVRDLSGVGGVLRPGIVHRLDRGTSGLLVVAKDDKTHRDLVRQFAGRTVEKIYLAVTLGAPHPTRGVVQAPIGRDAVHRHKMSTRAARGRPATTEFETIETFDGAAFLRLRLLTGRTHQIRVHLASIGHPIAGDAVYGGGRTPSTRNLSIREALRRLTRPALHAALLAFEHPSHRRRLVFESPLPEDMARLIDDLRTAEKTASGDRGNRGPSRD